MALRALRSLPQGRAARWRPGGAALQGHLRRRGRPRSVVTEPQPLLAPRPARPTRRLGLRCGPQARTYASAGSPRASCRQRSSSSARCHPGSRPAATRAQQSLLPLPRDRIPGLHRRHVRVPRQPGRRRPRSSPGSSRWWRRTRWQRQAARGMPRRSGGNDSYDRPGREHPTRQGRAGSIDHLLAAARTSAVPGVGSVAPGVRARLCRCGGTVCAGSCLVVVQLFARLAGTARAHVLLEASGLQLS